jgi:hypothetical protein
VGFGIFYAENTIQNEFYGREGFFCVKWLENLKIRTACGGLLGLTSEEACVAGLTSDI